MNDAVWIVREDVKTRPGWYYVGMASNAWRSEPSFDQRQKMAKRFTSRAEAVCHALDAERLGCGRRCKVVVLRLRMKR